MRMLKHLLRVDPPVLPMDSREKLLYAVKQVLQAGGHNGGPRCETASHKRSIQYSHNICGIPAVEHNLESAYAVQLLKGARNLSTSPVPKNAR
jgi:hypothetical protein